MGFVRIGLVSLQQFKANVTNTIQLGCRSRFNNWEHASQAGECIDEGSSRGLHELIVLQSLRGFRHQLSRGRLA